MSSKLASGIVSKGSSYNADPKHIVRREGWNTRIDFGDMKELKNSIKVNGFLKSKPLVVQRREDGLFEIVDGERRFTAVEELIKEGHKFEDGVPIVIEDKNMDDSQKTIIMLTSNLGKPFLPLEQATAYKRLLDGGMKPSQIAKAVGASDAHVKDRLALLDAAPEVQDALKNGDVGSTLAEQIVNHAKDDHKKQAEMVEKAKTKEGKKEVKEKIERKPREKTADKALAKLLDDTLSRLNDQCGAAGIEFDRDAILHLVSNDSTMAVAFYAGVACAFEKIQGTSDRISL
jgi:ParB/RepB/Spo0J family partition protein